MSEFCTVRSSKDVYNKAYMTIETIENLKSKALLFYEKHTMRLEVGFFVGGFLFDIIFSNQADDLFAIFQQVAYLIAIGSLIHYEFLYRMQLWKPEGRLKNLWSYRDLVMHFLLGSLLSVYSIFFVKSSSLVGSLVFLFIMIVILVANELPQVKKAKVSLKFAMYAICLFTFLSILFPIMLGFVGWLPLILAILSALGLTYLHFYLLVKITGSKTVVFKAVMMPGVSVVMVFLVFHSMGWIPPVPLSTKEQGLYHNIEKKDGAFYLSTENEWWRFWKSGDQDFKARPGDKIYFYAQIYSPARFSDEVNIHWLYKDPKQGWITSDKIPMKISGGRELGFRGYSVKSNYQPGEWRVQVETTLGQEISRLYFDVIPTDATEEKVFEVLKR